MKPIVLQTLEQDSDGHIQGPSGFYYRIDSFYAFHYIFTPPAHDMNHKGHVAIIGLRNSADHQVDNQVLLFEENGLTTDEEAKVVFQDALRRLGFTVWESFP